MRITRLESYDVGMPFEAPYAPLPPYAAAPAYTPGYGPPAGSTNSLALTGMIIALCGVFFNFFLFGLAGFVGGGISIAGLRKANAMAAKGVTVGNGRGFAIAGIVVGFGGAILWNLFFFSLAALPSSSP